MERETIPGNNVREPAGTSEESASKFAFWGVLTAEGWMVPSLADTTRSNYSGQRSYKGDDATPRDGIKGA